MVFPAAAAAATAELRSPRAGRYTPPTTLCWCSGRGDTLKEDWLNCVRRGIDKRWDETKIQMYIFHPSSIILASTSATHPGSRSRSDGVIISRIQQDHHGWWLCGVNSFCFRQYQMARNGLHMFPFRWSPFGRIILAIFRFCSSTATASSSLSFCSLELGWVRTRRYACGDGLGN